MMFCVPGSLGHSILSGPRVALMMVIAASLKNTIIGNCTNLTQPQWRDRSGQGNLQIYKSPAQKTKKILIVSIFVVLLNLDVSDIQISMHNQSCWLERGETTPPIGDRH